MSDNITVCSLINKIADIQEREETDNKRRNNHRYSLFPVRDELSYKYFRTQEAVAWDNSEMEFIRDKETHEQASPEEKHIIETILATFLLMDGVVARNLALRFIIEAGTAEESLFFVSQLHTEMIHAETYGLAAYTLLDEHKFEELMDIAENSPFIKGKVEFMEEFIYSSAPRGERFFAAAAVEGLLFPKLFAPVFWFRSQGKYPNFIFSNQLISIDESIHKNADIDYCLRYGGCPRPKALEILSRLIDLTDLFDDHILQKPVKDLNALDLKQYSRYLGDTLLMDIGHKAEWEVGVPKSFTWLDDISLGQKGNFYEVRTGEYRRGSLDKALSWKERAGKGERKDKEKIYNSPQEVDF